MGQPEVTLQFVLIEETTVLHLR